MPEPTHHPIRDLETFGTGGVHVNPLPPDQVRRLGDKRRTRRRATITIVASVFAVAGAIIPTTLAMTGDGGTPAPPLTTPTPSPTPTRSVLGLGPIPVDFPLDSGTDRITSDFEKDGPAASVETTTPELCNADPLGAPTAIGRLGFTLTGSETRNDVELRAYPAEKDASAVMDALSGLLATCTSWEGDVAPLTVTAFAGSTGLAFAVIEDPSAGTADATNGSVYLVTRVGSAILTLTYHGAVSPTTAQESINAMAVTEASITRAMCIFAADGCVPESTEGAARVYTYPGFHGTEVRATADLDLLRGTPADFRTFIAGLIPESFDDPECAMAAGPRVYRYSTDGLAAGYRPGCYDDQVIWAVREGEWTQVARSFQHWDCADLDAEGIPRSFVGGCYTANPRRLQSVGDFGPVSVDGLRLHMTQAQVEAAGGSVRWPENPEGCGAVYLPGTTPGTDNMNGYISDRGVVALSPVTFGFDGVNRRPRMSTPEGIGIGATRAEVERAYPNGTFVEIRGAWMVPLGDRERYRFDFADGKVASFSLEATDQNCYE